MPSPVGPGPVARFAPGLASLLALDGPQRLREIVIGMSVAAVAVPGGLATAQLMGLPPQVGLYACMAPALLYAVVGPSSRFLVIGPDTATCMLIAASLAGLGATSVSERMDVVAMMTLVVGALCLAASAARLGLISSLISKAVLVGYLAGVAISIIVDQLSPLAGLKLKSPGLIRPFVELWERQGEIKWATLGIGVGLLLIYRLCKAFLPHVPGAIVVIVVAIGASAAFDFAGMGISTIGAVPSGLPSLRIPSLDMNWDGLIKASAGVMLLSCSSGLITARAFGQQVGAISQPNRELAGFGLANVAAGLFQGFVVTGSDSRTALAVSSGARSGLVGIVAALTVAAVALFLTGPISYLPHAALAAILISAALDMLDFGAFARLARIGRNELVLALVATVGVIWIGVLEGVIVAVAATLAHLVFLAARPRDWVMGRAPGSGDLVTVHRDPAARIPDRIIVYLFEASLFFVNADYFSSRVREALQARPDARWLVLDASAMTHADSAAMETLAALHAELEGRGMTLLLGGGHGRFREVLDRSGLADRIGRDRIFTTAEDALEAAEAMRDAQPAPAHAPALTA